MQGALGVAIQAATLAGERILRGFHEDLHIEVKGDPVDRVTQVDRECQEIIFRTIRERYPEHGFVGEEESPKPPIPTQRTKPNVPIWFIDPIDGTSNFIKRLPHCGVSIGLEIDGEPVVGVLHFPIFGEMYTAIKGEGAFKNGERIHVSSCKRLKEAVVAEIYSDRTHRGKQVQFPPALAYRKFGSAITSLAYVADGRVDGTILQCYHWDICAAAVIIREAGGSIEWEEIPRDPAVPRIERSSDTGVRGSLRCIASASEEVCDELKIFVHPLHSC